MALKKTTAKNLPKKPTGFTPRKIQQRRILPRLIQNWRPIIAIVVIFAIAAWLIAPIAINFWQVTFGGLSSWGVNGAWSGSFTETNTQDGCSQSFSLTLNFNQPSGSNNFNGALTNTVVTSSSCPGETLPVGQAVADDAIQGSTSSTSIDFGDANGNEWSGSYTSNLMTLTYNSGDGVWTGTLNAQR